jgi:hypothetical protein
MLKTRMSRKRLNTDDHDEYLTSAPRSALHGAKRGSSSGSPVSAQEQAGDSLSADTVRPADASGRIFEPCHVCQRGFRSSRNADGSGCPLRVE